MPPRVRRVIRTGTLAGAGAMTDTTTVEIPRPGKGQAHDRGRFYYGKDRNWGIKFQVTVTLDARIAEHSDAYPAATSDRQIFDESKLPTLLEEKGVLVIGDAHYSLCEGAIGKKLGKLQAVEYKDRNQDIENVRAVIENANSRLKIWKVLGGTCRVDRHDLQFYTWIMSIACGLLNLEIEHGHPIRKQLARLKPRVANQVRERKRKRSLSPSDSEGQASAESEESEEWREIDKILRHSRGKHNTQDVIWYEVRFLGGKKRTCLAEFISQESLDHYHKHRPI
jgi:hypothetical protein